MTSSKTILSAAGEPLVTIRNLTFRYPDVSRPALQDVTASFRPGELVLLLGGTGSGKTTLLKLIKHLIAPFGTRTGEITFRGIEVSRLPKEQLAGEVGYLFQHTQDQLCMPTPLEEMAFGLRQLGVEPAAISRRCGELSCYFGMENWLDTPMEQLSGGQRQLTALASVLAADPSLLLLDEPTAQLDPVHSRSFLEQLLRLHRENNMTVLAVLHQPESIFFRADRILVLEQGKLVFSGSPQDAADCLGKQGHPLFSALPAGCRVMQTLGHPPSQGEQPLAESDLARLSAAPLPAHPSGRPLLKLKQVTAGYPGRTRPVLREVDLTLSAGEIFVLLGANGCGKTTLLKAVAGLVPLLSGSIRMEGEKSSLWRPTAFAQAGYLPQDPMELFDADRLEEDLSVYGKTKGWTREELEGLLDQPLFSPLKEVWSQNPLDLSGGQRQLAALAKLMLKRPKLLLLDEPGKGLDAAASARLGERLTQLSRQGMAILISCHDPDFAARYGHRCGFLFHGQLLPPQPPEIFFAGNRFYLTSLQQYLPAKQRIALLPEQLNVREEKG